MAGVVAFLSRTAMWRHAFLLAAAAGLTGHLGRAEFTDEAYYTKAYAQFLWRFARARRSARPKHELSRGPHADPRDHQSRHRDQSRQWRPRLDLLLRPQLRINRAIRAKGATGPIRIGVLGLGAGVTASLARAGDTLHYYEINPLIPQIANSEFSFLTGRVPRTNTSIMGDGRLMLESLPSENLDFLAVDAFSSDAIPMHLLTREALPNLPAPSEARRAAGLPYLQPLSGSGTGGFPVAKGNRLDRHHGRR